MNLSHAGGLGHIAYYSPIRLSPAADFFHAYPRLGSNLTQFAISDEYRTSIYHLGIPYLVTGGVLFVIALITNLYFFARRGVVPGPDDSRESNPDDRNAVGRSFLLFSCFINLAVILCLATGFESAFTMRGAVNAAHDVIRAAHMNVSEHLELPLDLLNRLAGEVAVSDPPSVPPDLNKLAKNVKLMFATRTPTFSNLLNNTMLTFGRLDAIEAELQHLSDRFFWFTLGVFIFCIGGLLCSFVCDATSPESKFARITAFSLLLLPMAAAWAHTAISTWIAVASGDFCRSANDYHHAVLSQANEDVVPHLLTRSNIFSEFDLQCPTQGSAAKDFKYLNDFLGSSDSTYGLEGFSTGLNALLKEDISPSTWESARFWMQDRWQFFGYCDTQVLLAGRLTFHICGDHGLSAMSAVVQLWICSCGLTLLFSAVVVLLTVGHPPSEFCSGRELMYLYGAPKLISAFGDVSSVLSRHSAYWKLEAGLLKAADKSTSSTEADDESYAGDNAKSDKDSTASSERSRRNAYTTHELRNEKAKRFKWAPDSDDTSSDSSRLS